MYKELLCLLKTKKQYFEWMDKLGFIQTFLIFINDDLVAFNMIY